MCIRYNWFEDENYFKQEESDVVIPTDLDPSQIKYYPNLEPNQVYPKESIAFMCVIILEYDKD